MKIHTNPDIDILKVSDKFGERTFGRVIGLDSMTNWFEVSSKPRELQIKNINEILFFPEEDILFDVRERRKHYGLKYCFELTMLNYPILFPLDCEDEPLAYQLKISVKRFEYFMKGNNEIDVIKEYDKLYPPQFLDVTCALDEFEQLLLTLTIRRVDEYNHFYVGKEC